MRKKWRDKERKQVQGEKKEKRNRRKVLNLFLLLLLALILNTLTFNPVFSAPSRGYEKLEYEEIFERKDPDGRLFSDYDEKELNSKNDYHENIIHKKVYKPDGTPMKEEYLPTAKFKVEVYRGGTVSGNNVQGGKLIFSGESSSETVKHLGEFQQGDIIKITDLSKAGTKGTLNKAYFNSVVREPGYNYNIPTGLSKDVNPGESYIGKLENIGAYLLAMQTDIKEGAYDSERNVNYTIFSTNGAKHTWGRNYYGPQKTPWEGWSHFVGVTFDVTDKKEEADMVMREIELVDAETGKVVESFKREIDNLDPFNSSKEKLIRTSSNPRNASGLEKNKKYILRAKYQFISFEEGKFDISKPETMNDKQRKLSTGVAKNELDVHYSYDENALREGIFDESSKITSSKGELKNLEYATFTWDYEVPKDVKQYVKIAGIIPDRFAEKEKDSNSENNWAVVFGQIEQNDIGMHKNVRLINENNEVIRGYRKGQPLRLIFPVEHIKGKDIIGTHPTKNPKAIIHVEVTDENGKVIHKERIQTDKELHPKKVIDMPITKPFKTDSNKITACATIDPIHKELGYNEDPRNDKICVTYKAGGVDIGVQAPIKVYEGNREVQFIEPNKSYRAEVDVRHFFGDEAVGLDPIKNPKVRVRYTVTDAYKRVLLNKQLVQTDKVLQPNSVITMPKSGNFTTEAGFVRVCAELDPIHRELGYSLDPTNDGPICRDIGMIKNYAMRDFQVFPKSVHFGKKDTVIKQPVTFTFTISNESSPETGGNLPSAPIVEIRSGGTVIWRQAVPVSPGGTTTRTVTLDRNIRVGNNDFVAIVNPGPRPPGEIEFKPEMPNPYVDNQKSTSILGVKYEKCDKCFEQGTNTRNEWRERWDWTERLGNPTDSTYQHCKKWEYKKIGEICTSEDNEGRCINWEDDYGDVCTGGWETVPYQYCVTTSYKEWHEIHDYWETYKIKEVNYSSKYVKDVQSSSGKIDLKRAADPEGRIKAGYGFGLEIITEYRTNRYNAPKPDPRTWNFTISDKYGNFPSQPCNVITRNPGVTKVKSPEKIYMEMPYFDRGGENVCYILELVGTKGPWYSEERTFKLPERSSFNRKSERKIYIGEKVRPNTGNRKQYPVKLVTPRPDKPDRFLGYSPEAPVGTKVPENARYKPQAALHDCFTFYIVIYPQDDMKTHIQQ